MATFLAVIAGVGIKYVPTKDQDGVVEGSEPVTQCSLRAVSADEHGLADSLGELVGRRVKVTILLEQGQLSDAE